MRAFTKAAAALLAGVTVIGFAAASAAPTDDHGRRGRDHRQERHSDGDRGRNYDRNRTRSDRATTPNRRQATTQRRTDDARRTNNRRTQTARRSNDRRTDSYRRTNNDRRRATTTTRRTTTYRTDNRRYDNRGHDNRHYDNRRHDNRYRGRSNFSIALTFGNRGYYDRSGRYYSRYRDSYNGYGQIVRRSIYNIRGYRADAELVEVRYGSRSYYGGERVCTVVARGPDARYVSYSELRYIANRHCSPYAVIRVYA
ncbi:MAG: hypothetical protein R3C60_13590 [Parvularculaceae bacterium]